MLNFSFFPCLIFTCENNSRQELHLAAKELGTLWLLGERGAFVQDRLENLPLLVQLVDHLRKKGRLGIFLRVVRALKFSVKPRLDCNLVKINIPMPVQIRFTFLFLISQCPFPVLHSRYLDKLFEKYPSPPFTITIYKISKM